MLMLLVWSVNPAKAELRVDITRGTVEPLPIAVTDYIGKVPQEKQIGRDIARVIRSDLERSGPVQTN